MPLNLRQKRLILGLTEPALRPLYSLYRLLTLESFADRRLPGPSPSNEAREPQKILVVRLDNIGDVLLCEPAISALRQRFPRARLDVVVAPEGKAVLQNNPNIDSLIVCKIPWHAAWRGEKVNWVGTLKEVLPVIYRLRKQRYDLAIELRGDVRDILITIGSGARIRVGCGKRGGGFLLDRDLTDQGKHRVDFALSVVAAVGAASEPRAPILYPSDFDRSRAVELLPAGPYYIAFHLGSGFASKCLPTEKFAVVARELAGHGYRLVVVGGPGERKMAEGFVADLDVSVINAAGKLSLLGLAAALDRCSLFIGNDSGPMHIAAAVGTPVVAFFGPSEPAHYHPYGVDYGIVGVDLRCRPCDHVHCVHSEYLCMTSIKPEDIVSAALELLSRSTNSEIRVSGVAHAS